MHPQNKNRAIISSNDWSTTVTIEPFYGHAACISPLLIEGQNMHAKIYMSKYNNCTISVELIGIKVDCIYAIGLKHEESHWSLL